MTLVSVSKKKAAETVTIVVSFKNRLAWNEALTGTPTAVEQYGGTDLTISGVGLNTLERWIEGQCIPASSGVELTVAGGIARTDYTIRVAVSTNASPTQTLIEDIRLKVI